MRVPGTGKRRRETLPEWGLHGPIGADAEQIWERRQKTLKRIRVAKEYDMFPPSRHSVELKIGQRFLDSLGPNTKILEVGAGSGRLTEFILKRSKIRPENYTILDYEFGRAVSAPLTRTVFSLLKKGKLRILGGNFLERDFGKESYDHILVPQSFFMDSATAKNRRDLARMHDTGYPDNRVNYLALIVEHLKPALRPKGSIRVSSIQFLDFPATAIKTLRLFFPEFDVADTNGGFIFIKK